MTLAEERAAFNKMMKAKAILMAVEWAGSAPKLAMMIGYTRYAGYKWLQRVDIPPTAARALECLPGFPVKASDLIEPVYKKATKKPRCCPHCYRVIHEPGDRPGCLPSFNGRSKRPRKKAASKPRAAAGATPKTKPKTTKRSPA